MNALNTALKGTAIALLTAGLTTNAFAADASSSGQTTIVDQAWSQIAASKGSKCKVERIEKAWIDAGKPKVKGWAEDVTDAEAKAAYECIKGALLQRFAKSDEKGAQYEGWAIYNTQAYESSTHGGRFVNNYADKTASVYGKFEESGPMPVGSILVKDSFGINKKGQVKPGPLFTMIKMEKGFNEKSDDWRYALIFPNGKLMGATNGKNSKKLGFCINCHISAKENDSMLFIPDEFRVN